ncbi:MAG: small multi-drug export protein [Bacteroidia bacterium]|nr:small multi-drug export protein [Bacteroidia bacterium]
MELFLKILPVFFAAMLGFGKISVPSAIGLFGFNHILVLSVTWAGGLTGVVLFTFISDVFLKWIEKIKNKYSKKPQKPKRFTKSNRRIIRIRKKFGIWGIAFLTPIGLSTPVGTFIAERFYKDKKKVIFVIGAGILFWYTLIYFLLFFFKESFSKFL